MKAFLNKILRQLLNDEDDKKNTIRIISGVSDLGDVRYHWAEKQGVLPKEKSVPNEERERLIYRLRTMAQTEVLLQVKAMIEEGVLPQEQKHWSGMKQKLLSPMGVERAIAMCYEPAAPDVTYTFTCPRCGRIVKKLDYDSRYELHKIASLVKKMKQLGYDVKTERVCSICGGSSGKHPLDVDTFFYFRFKEMEAYHVTVANHSRDYEIVLDFLHSKNSYYISEHRDIIEKMLGVKI